MQNKYGGITISDDNQVFLKLLYKFINHTISSHKFEDINLGPYFGTFFEIIDEMFQFANQIDIKYITNKNLLTDYIHIIKYIIINIIYLIKHLYNINYSDKIPQSRLINHSEVRSIIIKDEGTLIIDIIDCFWIANINVIYNGKPYEIKSRKYNSDDSIFDLDKLLFLLNKHIDYANKIIYTMQKVNNINYT